MRNFIFTFILLSFSYFSFSKTVTVNVSGTYDGSQLDVGGRTTLYIGDSIIFNVVVGDLVPTSGTDTDVDTISTSIRLRWVSVVDGPASYDVGLVGLGKTGAATNVISADQKITAVKLVEGRTNQIYVVFTGGTSATYAPGGSNYISASTQVISNVGNDIFAEGNGVQINNPVSNGQLSIQLDGGISSLALELITLEGEVVTSFELEKTATIDVSHLNAGMYLLRDRNTLSIKKIIIQ